MEVNFESSLTQSLLSHEDEEKEIVSEAFNFKFNFFGSSTKQESKDSDIGKDGASNETEVDYDNADNEDEEEFSFVIDNSSSIPVSGDGTFSNAQIQPKISLFNQDLLLRHEDYTISDKRLPSESHVKQVLTKTSPDMTLHKGGSNPTYGTSSGLYYAGGIKSPELSKKSNSTGFSRLWGLKDVLHRSGSDGSESFIAKLYRSQKENQRRWTMKRYSHQSRIEVQKNKLFLASARK